MSFVDAQYELFLVVSFIAMQHKLSQVVAFVTV